MSERRHSYCWAPGTRYTLWQMKTGMTYVCWHFTFFRTKSSDTAKMRTRCKNSTVRGGNQSSKLANQRSGLINRIYRPSPDRPNYNTVDSPSKTDWWTDNIFHNQTERNVLSTLFIELVQCVSRISRMSFIFLRTCLHLFALTFLNTKDAPRASTLVLGFTVPLLR